MDCDNPLVFSRRCRGLFRGVCPSGPKITSDCLFGYTFSVTFAKISVACFQGSAKRTPFGGKRAECVPKIGRYRSVTGGKVGWGRPHWLSVWKEGLFWGVCFSPTVSGCIVLTRSSKRTCIPPSFILRRRLAARNPRPTVRRGNNSGKLGNNSRIFRIFTSEKRGNIWQRLEGRSRAGSGYLGLK
jgi:hypothetical protein